jgi:hypothetical protein
VNIQKARWKPDGSCAFGGAESILGGESNSATTGEATVLGG